MARRAIRRGDIVSLPANRVFAYAVVRDRSSLTVMLLRLHLPHGISARASRPLEVLIDKPFNVPRSAVKATGKRLEREQLFSLELGLAILYYLYDPRFWCKASERDTPASYGNLRFEPLPAEEESSDFADLYQQLGIDPEGGDYIAREFGEGLLSGADDFIDDAIDDVADFAGDAADDAGDFAGEVADEIGDLFRAGQPTTWACRAWLVKRISGTYRRHGQQRMSSLHRVQTRSRVCDGDCGPAL